VPIPDGATRSAFAATFPDRFAAVVAEARGAMAAVEASAAPGGERLLSDADLRLLREVYGLRVELEIEVAGILWRTAAVVRAAAAALEWLGRRPRPRPALARPSAPGGVQPAALTGRRRAAGIGEDSVERLARAA
jgi:hypothetical protein